MCRYKDLMELVHSISLEELIMAVRRQSQGFSRGSSAFRGVTYHPTGVIWSPTPRPVPHAANPPLLSWPSTASSSETLHASRPIHCIPVVLTNPEQIAVAGSESLQAPPMSHVPGCS